MKVRFSLSIGFPGAKHKETVEFPDDTTDEEIQHAYEDWCENYMDGGWWRVEEGDEE